VWGSSSRLGFNEGGGLYFLVQQWIFLPHSQFHPVVELPRPRVCDLDLSSLYAFYVGLDSTRRNVDFCENDEKGHLTVIMPERREVEERDRGSDGGEIEGGE